MAKKINFGSLGIALEANYEAKIKEEEEKKKKNQEDNSGKEEFLDANKTREEANKKKKSVLEFKRDLKKSLLTEALYSLYNAAFGNKIEYENEALIKKGLVTKFVEEQGVDELLNSFRGKSMLLSEYAATIDRYYNAIVEANDEIQSNSIDDEIKDTFFDDLFSAESEDVAMSIKMRVANAIEDFNVNNQEEKMDLENIISISQNKIMNAKTQELKEQYQLDANKQMFKIRQRKKNIFESMVYNTAKACFTRDDIRENYSTNGKIDMDKIVESCEILYTFLETLNTAKIVEINEDYLQSFIKDFSKK